MIDSLKMWVVVLAKMGLLGCNAAAMKMCHFVIMVTGILKTSYSVI